ncbi:BatD family protein [Roseivirga echinicomitans]
MRITSSKFILVACLFCLGLVAKAQSTTVELGPDEVGLNQLFTIKVTVLNGKLKSYTDFPNIDGFAKRGTSSSSSTNIINGQVSSSQSITQRYLPLEEGTYQLEDFSLEVNGEEIFSKGKRIKIIPPVETRRNTNRTPYGHNPFDDLFGSERDSEFIDVKEDAFLALTTDKDEVYLGEGFTATFAFYVAEDNRAPLQFNDPGTQLSEVLKTLRPTNSWEENFNIESIFGEKVEINGKGYMKYKIYRATYFPLNLTPIVFPSVPFEMIKYQVAKSPSFFGRDRKEDFKTFYSKEKTVKVKPLPPHPLKDVVAVGSFVLDEKMSKRTLQTGGSFEYTFGIYGEGNISGISPPKIPENKNIEFYPPDVSQDINRSNSKVTGSKKFTYYGLPNEPGTYDMGDYFSWVYFDPKAAKYDTLKSQVKFEVTGESKRNNSISSVDLGSFYDSIEDKSNNLESLTEDKTMQVLANILILAMFVGAGFIYFKK